MSRAENFVSKVKDNTTKEVKEEARIIQENKSGTIRTIEFEEFTQKEKPPKTKKNVLLFLDIEVINKLDEIKKNTGRSRNEIANEILKRVLDTF